MRRRLPVLLSLVLAAIAALTLTATAGAAVVTKTISYGPFTIPAGAGDPHDHHSMGEVPNRQIDNIAKPCTNCSIVGARPALVYADGSSANLDTGPMLHHAVFSAKGKGKADATCGGAERFFASGNERTPLDVSALPYGYGVGKADSWSLLIELMNWATEAKTVSMQVTWTYATGTDATSRKPIRPTWHGSDVCGLAEFAAPFGFSDTHFDSTAPLSGAVISTIGHVHDHGVSVETTNETRGTSICTSTAATGETPGYVTPDGRRHVSSLTQCTADPVARVARGDLLQVHATYNVPAGHHAVEDAMGIMILYVNPS